MKPLDYDQYIMGAKSRFYKVKTIDCSGRKHAFHLETTDFKEYAFSHFHRRDFPRLIEAQETDENWKKLRNGEQWTLEDDGLVMKVSMR